MKKLSVLLLLLTAQLIFAGNLLKNSQFDDTDLYCDMLFKAARGKFKVEHFIEDRTWNKCVRVETTGYRLHQGHRHLAASLIFGKNGENKGFPVQGGQTYDFSFDLKGNIQVSLWVCTFDKAVNIKSKEQGKALRPIPKTAQGEVNSWTRVKGSFKVPADSRFAVLEIKLWADSSRQNHIPEPGSYFMVDNIEIKARKNLITAAAADNIPAAAARPALTVPWNGKAAFNCKKPKISGIELPLQISDDDRNITIAATFPAAGKTCVPVKNNGKNLWNTDDVLDIFFAPVKNDRAYSQFALASGGGRYQATGNQPVDYARWSGKVTSQNHQRNFTVTIPWKMLGFASRPARGTILPVNIGIRLNGQSYSFSPIKLGFNDLPNFGNIIFGSLEDYKNLTAQQLKKDAPEKLLKDIAAWQRDASQALPEAIAQAQDLRSRIASAKLGSAPFLTARLPVTGSFFAPLEITPEQLLNHPVQLRGARNEKLHLPLAIVNRTQQIGAYRVIVHQDASSVRHVETMSLDNGFPVGNITFREVLQVKDSDGKSPGMIFDPLPRMNEAQTITIAPNSTAAVWLEFDLNNVPAGKYAGFIRVIPLMETADFSKKDAPRSSIRDYPLNVEVLPITLPPPMDLAMFQQPINQDYLNKSCELGQPRQLISGYAFKFKYDAQGNIIDAAAPLADQIIEKVKKYYDNGPAWVKRRYMIGYSIYNTFKKINLPKSIKPFTPEWEKCWRNHVRAMMDICRKHHIDKDMLYAEIADEPHGEQFKEYLAAARIAHAAEPSLRLTMTWGTVKFGVTAEMAAQFDPYVNEQMYWWGLLNEPEFMRQLKNYRKRPGVTTAIYECSTSIRENLHSYFRLHPWRTRHHNFEAMGFYCWTNNLFGLHSAADWRTVLTGALTYRSGDKCIPSVRLYALAAGTNDMRYYDALKAMQEHPDIQKFLRETTARTIQQSHDPTLPDKFKDEAIKILLKK